MKYLIGFILNLIFFIAGFYFGNQSKCPVCPEVKESIDSARKELPPVIKETEKPKPIREVKQKRPLLAEITKDSSLIDYFFSCNDIRVYSDTLTDSSGTIISEDSVRGELLKKKVTFIPNQLTIREIRTVEKPVPQSGLFIGAEIGANPTIRKIRIAPELEYLTKSGYAYSYNFDVINNIHSVGVKKKLKL